ncbi:MAG TPA: tetratricopeptide repeat protein [Pirellulaceae bacterium]|nr:tetratricopeptide repeat protein [Pirellulaceae bacterium]
MNVTESTPNVIDVIAEEFVERFRQGERPAISEYEAKYPEQAQAIRELFPALVVMERLKPESKPVPTSSQAECASEVASLGRLGDYRIVREIGRGGMGIVYEAVQESLGRKVALKVLPKQLIGDDSRQARFDREARAAARLHHTNIVPVFGVGQECGLHYYAMQYIHGLGLDEVLRELKRLKNKDREPSSAKDGSPASAADKPQHEVTATVTQALLTGQFDPPGSAARETPQVAASSTPPTLTRSASEGMDTAKARLSQTLRLSESFTLPGVALSGSNSNSTIAQSVARLGIQVSEALHYAHEQGVLHRDVKPSNLLLDTRGTVWVTDFGLAKADDQRDLTETGDVLGTLRYMAPEMFSGKADRRSDVYSLGLTLYELLALRPAFDEADRGRLIRLVLNETPPRLRNLDPSIPRDLETIIHKAIDREPSHRYASAQEFADDLQRFFTDEPIHARRPSALQRLAKFTRRHRAVIATACLCLLIGTVLLAGTIGWAVRDRVAQQAEFVRERSERQSRLTAQVESILDEVHRRQQEQKWPEALAAAKQARTAAAGGKVEPAVDAQVGRALRDLEMLQRLEQIRLERAAVREGKFDATGAAAAYAQAFRDFGVDLEQLPPHEAVSRLKQHSEIGLPLAAALDDFSVVRTRAFGTSDAGRLSLVAVARGLDPDPTRDRLRALLGRTVSPELRDELRTAAESIDVARQPPATLMLFAGMLRRLGLEDAGQSLLRQAQQRFPDDFWINLDLANSLHDTKDYEGAVRFYTAAVAIRPSASAAHNNLGNVLHDQKRLDEAEACYRHAIELDPTYATAHNNLSYVLSKQKKLDEAEASCRRAIELDPTYANAHTKLGDVLSEQKKLDEAEACHRRAIELDPNLAPAHNNLGIVLSKQKKPDEAEACYRRAIELDPNLAPAHNNLGIVLRDQKKLDEAEASCRRAIELDPNDAFAHNNLGNVLHDQKRLDEAEACYRPAIERDPTNATAHNNLGKMLHDQKKLDEAEACYRRVIELDPNYAAAHYNLGNVLRHQNKLDEAEACYRRAIELDPNLAPAHTNLGIVLHDQNKLDEAEVSLRLVIELDPNYATAHNNLGYLLSKQKKLDEAEACYRRAIELDPNYALAHNNLGNGLRDQKKLDEAITCYRTAIELDPNYASAHNNLGIAIRNLAQRLAAGPDSKGIDAVAQVVERAAGMYLHRLDQWPPPGNHNWLPSGMICLAAARPEEYRRTCTRLVEEFGQSDDPQIAALLVWCCKLRAGAVADWDAVVGMGEKALLRLPGNGRLIRDLGALLYRAGRFEEALERLGEGIECRPEKKPIVWDWLWLAMVQHRLGDTEKARDSLRQAQQWMDQQAPNRNLELELLRTEAEELLGIPPAEPDGLASEKE